MKMKRLILTYLLIWSSLFASLGFAQVNDTSRMKPAVKESAVPKQLPQKEKVKIEHDLRVGVDISTLISGAITPIRRGVDLSVEYNITPDLYVVMEGGYNYFKKENIRIEYISNGNYLRAGVDYNLRASVEENDHDIFYLGGRIGYSSFTQEVPFYIAVNDYWGNTTSSIAAVDNDAVWGEFVAGFKVEVLKNWFLGMGLRLKMFLVRDKTAIEPVQFVPGYARNYNSSVADFNYTIYYNIPLNYKKKKILVYEKADQ